MGFPENVLARGERVERDLHPHWLTVVAPTLVGLVLVAGCVLAVAWTPNDSTGNTIQWIGVAVLVLVAVFAVFVPYLRWRTTRYVITSHRVMVRRGILTKTGKDITLSKITDVSFEQTLLDRVIRAGSLHIESAGDSPDEDLRYIPRSNEVQQLINRLIDEDDLRRRAHGRSGAADAYDTGYDTAYDTGHDDAYDRGAGSADDTTVIRQGQRDGRDPRDGRDRPPLAEERRRPGTAGDDTY
jgi:uncharacterized membrane protein YdbT with pleckstrin-like domain